MHFAYTWHAKTRMIERNIATSEVEEVMKNPIILKQGKNNTLRATGFWRNKFLNIIFIKQDSDVLVITVYPSEKVNI